LYIYSMKAIFLIFFLTISGSLAYCQQTETDAVKETINTLFNAMRKGDSTMLKSVFAKDMLLQSIGTDKDGKKILTNETGDAFAKAIGTPHAVIYDERITFDDIKIDGALASVWAPYKFYLGDKFSHCGVDVFQLMKTTAGWKVIYIVNTRRKDACVE
jgi:hypothetical protein